MLAFERQLWAEGCRRIAGVDEAGRGPLAGPVVAAAVIFNSDFLEDEAAGLLAGLTDSKQLSEARRNAFFDIIAASATVGIGLASVAEIDAINILRATHLAMRRAVDSLATAPDHIIVDGRPVPGLATPSTAIIKGDGRSLSIAAASVMAKVTRDHLMVELDGRFPCYGFSRHKGYGSARHMQALLEYGPCPDHRRSFRPVREAEDLRGRTSRLDGVTP